MQMPTLKLRDFDLTKLTLILSIEIIVALYNASVIARWLWVTYRNSTVDIVLQYFRHSLRYNV